MDDLMIGEQKYVSSKRAAEITGYAKDYIGQLCREGRVEARLVGRSWYVREAAIKDHRFGLENAPPAAVMPESVEEAPKEWVSPTYKLEVPAPIPLVTEAVTEIQETIPEKNDSSTLENRALQMQEAWQSWFSQNKPEDQLEELVVSEVQSQIEDIEEEEVPLVINRFDNLEATEEPQQYEEALVRQLQPQEAIDTRPTRSYFVFKLALAVIALSSLTVAILGTGGIEVGDRGVAAAATRFITGANIYSK